MGKFGRILPHNRLDFLTNRHVSYRMMNLWSILRTLGDSAVGRDVLGSPHW